MESYALGLGEPRDALNFNLYRAVLPPLGNLERFLLANLAVSDFKEMDEPQLDPRADGERVRFKANSKPSVTENCEDSRSFARGS
jgi:hypothetical protein